MRSSRRNRLVLLAAVALMLGGCADYLNRRDSITLGAGNAPEANAMIQTIDPFPDNAENTDITFSR